MHGQYIRTNTKPLTSELISLDMCYFAKRFGVDVAKMGSVHWTWASGSQASISFLVKPGQGVEFSYKSNGKPLCYLVRVVYSRMKLAGRRPWWLCPQCNRRCRILYGRRIFVCRQCAGVIYETQRTKSLWVRADNRLYRLRHKLGASAFDEAMPDKPKHMHWSTYSRLALAIQEAKGLRYAAWLESVATFLDTA